MITEKLTQFIKENEELKLEDMGKKLNLSRIETGELLLAYTEGSESLEKQLNNLPHLKLPE